MKTHFLQVKEVITETPDAATIEFWHPLSEQIKYKAGQFITVIVPADEGKKVRRSYSMSTSPHTDTAVGITVKRVKNGLVSNYLLNNVKKGDFIEVIEPMGNFYLEPDADKERNIFLIGGVNCEIGIKNGA
jgi:ring-1,2-phenylacetyl-CoA epoxidase subunit PaaE